MSPFRIPLSEPLLGGNEARYLQECVDTNFVSSVGPFVERFEREFADFVGAPYAVAACNGTSALHVALRLVGVGPGDEVLVSTFTFVASTNPIRYLGAVPVLIDSEPHTWNMDPELVVEEVEARARSGRLPSAIVVVHIYGHPAELDPILEVASKYDIPVVEDAAESLGAHYRGRRVGTLGTVGCFSFNGNKVMTTGGGGMITTADPELARRAKHLTTQARLPGIAYQHDEVGYNYRMTNVTAALGVAQLEQLPGFLRAKRAIAERYQDAFRGVPEITAPREPEWGSSAFWLYSIEIVPKRSAIDRDALLSALRRSGIEARPLWTPLHTMPLFADSPRVGGEVAESAFARGVSLPSSSSLTVDDQARVIDVVREVVAEPKPATAREIAP